MVCVLPIFAVFCIGILSTCQAAEHPQCHQNELNQCLEQLQNLTYNKDLMFAASVEELDTVCKGLNQAMACITSFTDRCLPPAHNEYYKELTSGTRQIINQMCTQGSDVRKRYFKHAGCMKTISDDYMKCFDKYTMDLEKLREEQSAMDQTEQLKQTCCIFDHHVHCSKTLVLHGCGQDAADLINEIFTTGQGALMKMHCAEYTYDSEHCSSDAVTRTHFISVILGLLAYYFLSLRH